MEEIYVKCCGECPISKVWLKSTKSTLADTLQKVDALSIIRTRPSRRNIGKLDPLAMSMISGIIRTKHIREPDKRWVLFFPPSLRGPTNEQENL